MSLADFWFVLFVAIIGAYIVLDGFDLSRDETEALIMQARVKAGWIKEEDLAPPPAEEIPAETTIAPA